MSASDTPVSHENSMARVAKELSLNIAKQYGIFVFNATKENVKLRKYFRYDALAFDIMATGYVSLIVEYAVQPENNLPENFIYTGKVYISKGMRETVPCRTNWGLMRMRIRRLRRMWWRSARKAARSK